MKDTTNLFPSNVIDWDLTTKVGTIEVSDLNGRGYKFIHTPIISIESTKTGKIQEFEFLAIDWADPSHEDIGGWRYDTIVDGRIWELIFIND